MEVLDIFFIGIIIVFGIKGLFKGAVKEVIGFLVLFLSLFLIPIFAEKAGIYLSKLFSWDFSSSAAYVLGFFGIFIILLLASWIISFLVMKTVNSIGIGFLDKIGGSVLGAIKGFLILALFINISLQIEVTKKLIESQTENSKIYPIILSSGTIFMQEVEKVKKITKDNEKSISNVSSNIANKVLDNDTVKNSVKALSDEKNLKIMDESLKNIEKEVNKL